MSLLPSKPDTSTVDADTEPRVIGVESDDADDVISALSSETARELLGALHEEPAAPSELADRVDTSLQNAQYHLEKLQSAGAVSVVDTAYSAKGREMDVYAPSDQPLVIFAGDEDETSGLRAALSRLVGGLGILGLGSLAVQQLYGDTADGSAGTAPEGGGSPAPTADGQEAAVPTNATENGSFEMTAEVVTRTVENGTTYVMDSSGTEYVLVPTENESSFTVEAPQEVAETVTQNATELANQTTTGGTDQALAGLEPGLLFFAGGLVILSLWLTVWYAQR